MSSILPQAKKEWLEFRRDRLSLSLAIVLPIFALILFGFGIKLESSRISAVFEDYDRTALSRRLIDCIKATSLFEETGPAPGDPEAESEGKDEEVDRELKMNSARLKVIVPNGFARHIFREEEASFRVLIDGTDISNAQIIYNTIATVSNAFEKALKDETLKSIEDEKNIKKIEIASVAPDINVLYNPDRKETDFILPGAYGVILFMFPALLGAVATAREKEHGTIKRLAAAGAGPGSLILGKALLYCAVGLIMAMLVYLTGRFVFEFGFDFGSWLLPLPVTIGTVLYVMSAVLFGMMLGISANSQTTAVQATSTLGFFPCLLLSGFVYPIENIPYPLSLLANLVPAKYFIELARSTMVRGAGFSQSWVQLLALLGFIALFAGLSLYFAGRCLRPTESAS
ncbi:MAG: ABC transporter permease [Candidatus Obscuribacterales bacterium]